MPGKVELDDEEAELPAVVGDVVRLVHERARVLELELDIDVPRDLRCSSASTC